MSRGMSTEMPDLDPRWDAEADLIVVGSGVAGLTAALEARALGLRVLVVSKDAMEESNTRWAQGGVAVVLLVLDMVRRIRRVRYRAEIAEKLDAEEAEAAAADARGDDDAGTTRR